MLRQVTIEEYWPLIVKNTAEFGQIAIAENPEFNLLVECIYRVLKDGFIADATEYGVERWEKIIGISPAPGATLDERKATILYYLSVKLPYTWRVLKQMLTDFLGDEQFVMEYVNDEGKLVLHTDRIADYKLQTIQDLLERVLPQNIEVAQYNQSIDIPWRDWTPGFVQLDYIDTDGHQYVSDVGVKLASDSKVEMTLRNEVVGIYKKFITTNVFPEFSFSQQYERVWNYVYNKSRSYTFHYDTPPKGEIFNVVMDGPRFYYNGRLKIEYDEDSVWESGEASLFASSKGYWGITIGVYHIRISRAGVLQRNFVPALDPTGAPCLFDTVTRTPYYSDGSADFIYSGAEQAATAIMTLDLDAKSYAQLTEHGVRRLYHVPDGCNMSKAEYAAANGYKELVEPPMPADGYWVPQWRETDTQLILEWIETEEPMEVNENE